MKTLHCALIWATILLGAPQATAADYAFLVGVHQYDRAELNPLKYSELDVARLASTLFKNGLSEKDIVLMTPAQVARNPRFYPESDKIRKELGLILAELTPRDSIIVGFSGHGVQFKGDPDNYFCPLDAKLDDKRTLVNLAEVYQQLERCRASRKLLLVDACRDDPLSALAKSAKRIELEAVRERKPPVLQGGTIALFSCSAGEQSFEDPKLKSGLFFHFVTEGLAGAADLDEDEQIDLPELKQYAVKKVQRWARVELGRRQTPEQRGRERGLFTLIRLPENRAETLYVTNSVGMKLRLIPSGSFLMGSPAGDSEAFDTERPQHRVRITKPFYLGTTEVTQGQWTAVMGTKPWSGQSYVREGSDYPATYVSWEDATEFCRKLSAKEGVTYRLPTEAEWEYACRAGTTTVYSFGDESQRLGDYAWFDENAYDADEKYAHRVGQKRANPWGLHDMHGNVWEWCSDWFEADYYGTSPGADPAGPSTGSDRVFRGGSWDYSPRICRSAGRRRGTPGRRDYDVGFRVARSSISK